MATKRLSDGSSLANTFKMGRGATSAAIPEAPTIGTATAVTPSTATVAYTAATLGALGSTFTATSNPSSITGTGASPITVSGLASETNYTFTVKASNANGDSPASSASNQITTNAAPGDRGLFGGGSNTNVIDYITISSTGNATDFGDLTVSRDSTYGTTSSITRAVFMGGSTAGPYSNVMDYVTVSTTGNATDFGDLSETIAHGTGTGNNTRGIFAAGYGASAPTNKIEYITIATTGNSTDFGDTSSTRFGLTGVSSPTRSVFCSGYQVNVIDYVTIATTGNATDFGDMSTDARNYVASACSATRGLFAGGYDGAQRNVIDYITIATIGNATDFGDLSSTGQQFAGCSNSVRGVFQRENTMEYVTITTTGNTTNFGSMSAGSRVATMGTSNGHGGLG